MFSTRRILAHSAPSLALLALLLAPPLAEAQELPNANDLIAAHLAASGGADLFLEGSSVSVGTFALPGMGLTGSYELVQRAPNQMRMDITLPGLGALLTGYDGTVGWTVNPITGPQLLAGAELDQMREQASLAAGLRDPAFVSGRETVGEREYEGQPCWRVHLTWASGRESFDCYAKDTGLLLASEANQASPMGEISSVTVYLNYQRFEGRLLPTRMVQRAAGQEQVLTLTSVEFGEVGEERILPPAAIQTLIGG
jgi:hypothetical protein